MSDTVSKRLLFCFIFNVGNKEKSQEAKSYKYGGWGMITMLLVTNSVVFRDMWEGALSRRRNQLWF
jgi:hypothetical protein